MFLVTLIVASPAAAQSSNPTELKVAIMVVPPFVMRRDGSYTGFGIDLWNAVATEGEDGLSLHVGCDIARRGVALEKRRYRRVTGHYNRGTRRRI
jgi:ABC-type amino acid transport substrate-binding protein